MSKISNCFLFISSDFEGNISHLVPQSYKLTTLVSSQQINLQHLLYPRNLITEYYHWHIN